MHRLALLACVGALVGLTGCAPKTFTATGFHHPELPVTARYSDASRRAFVSDDWHIDNYVVDDEGTPLRPKQGKEYIAVSHVDVDGDGVAENYEVPRFDLKLLNKKNAGVLWERAIVLQPDQGEQTLRVLMQDYADALSGTGFDTVDLIDGEKKARARQFASKIIDARDRRVGTREAYDATIEVASVDQLKLDPESRDGKLRIVLVRTGYWQKKWLYGKNFNYLPVVLMLGYWNRPDAFEASAKDFDTFVELFELGPPGAEQMRPPAK